jgi:hypothetical protein
MGELLRDPHFVHPSEYSKSLFLDLFRFACRSEESPYLVYSYILPILEIWNQPFGHAVRQHERLVNCPKLTLIGFIMKKRVIEENRRMVIYPVSG